MYKLIDSTIRCAKCNEFFFSYDGSKLCDICSYEQYAEEQLKEKKDDEAD